MIRAAAKNHDDVARRGRAERLRGAARRTRRAQRHDDACAAPQARRQGLCPHRGLRRRDLQLVRASARRQRAGLSRLRRPADRAAALRRKPAPDGGVLSQRRIARFGVATARQVQGKQLSYNNINDTDAAYECVAEFDPARSAACAIIKHANPCGVARRRRSARRLSQGAAPAIRSRHSAASSRSTARSTPRPRAPSPRFSPKSSSRRTPTEEAHGDRRRQEEFAAAARRRPARSARAGPDRARPSPAACWCRRRDNAVVDDMTLKPVTKRAPSNAELRDLRFAFRVAKHVKSNTIVYAKDGATVGIGAGQMSRVDSARIAARKAAGRRARQPASRSR